MDRRLRDTWCQGWLIGAVLLLLGSILPSVASGGQADSLRLADLRLAPGDTSAIEIYIANSQKLGAYTARFAFDTSLVEFVNNPENDSVLVAEQLRGDFKFFTWQRPEPGVIAGVAAFAGPHGLDSGTTATIQLWAYAKPYAKPGTKTVIKFIDAPFDSNASNWFALFSGQGQYRPVRIDGAITIKEKK